MLKIFERMTTTEKTKLVTACLLIGAGVGCLLAGYPGIAVMFVGLASVTAATL